MARNFFTPMTLEFSCEIMHDKLWKSINICKSYSKKITGTFLLDTAYLFLCLRNLCCTGGIMFLRCPVLCQIYLFGFTRI